VRLDRLEPLGVVSHGARLRVIRQSRFVKNKLVSQ
jgi:hypothetical protein